MQFRRVRYLAACAGVAAVTLVVAACGSGTGSGGGGTSGSVSVPSDVSVGSFNLSFSALKSMKSVTKAGKGLVGVLLPDTTTSVRWVDFDAPYLKQAFQAAGYPSSDFKIDNAQGNDATELADAQADISAGATILIVCPIDNTVGDQIQQYAQQHGVKFIAYDRAIFTGTKTYYVSFDGKKVGEEIGQGFEQCVTQWNVAKPQVFVLDGGEDTDANAVAFAQGYNSTVWNTTQTPLKAPMTNSKGYTLVGDQITPGWVNSTGGTIFQQQFRAHPNINATIEANDGLAQAVITDLKNTGVGPKKIPTTGQDATLQGMVNILQGFQCGSVYKPVYKEAEDAVAVATILRAGLAVPPRLLNGTTSPGPGASGNTQPASLLTSTWVTASNMQATVIKDKFVDASAICSAAGASACSQAGITP
jgi:D-xylose transport system substrate-binding protein